MGKGVIKVILIGCLGHDPENNTMPSGDAVSNCSVATSETWKDKNTGEKIEKTEWHRVVFYRRLAEVVAKYLKKGAKIYVEGKLQTRKWQDKNGNTRYTTEIVANEMQMLDSRCAVVDSPANTTVNQYQAAQHQSVQNHEIEFDDDCPF